MIVKLLAEHHLEFLSMKGGCRGSSESTPVKMPHCLKLHVMAIFFIMYSLSSSSRVLRLSRRHDGAEVGVDCYALH